MRRQQVSFPLPFCLLTAALPFGAVWTILRPVGLRRERGPALTAAFHSVPFQLGTQGRVQREDSSPEPPA